MREAIYQATRGGVDLYLLAGAREAALFPVRIRLGEGLYPACADHSVHAKPDSALVSYVNRRYQLGLAEFSPAVTSPPPGAGPRPASRFR